MGRVKYYEKLLELYSSINEARITPEDVDAKAAAFTGAKGASAKQTELKKSASGKVYSSQINAALKGTAGNIELKKQLYNALPSSPQNLPMKNDKEQVKGMGNFIPVLVKGKGKPMVYWNTPQGPIKGLQVQGEIGAGYNYNTVREYLADLIADESGEDVSRVKGQSPFARESMQNLVQDPATGAWSNADTGEIIENPWFPWEPEDFNEILVDSKSTQGIVPGLTTRHIYRLVTDPPIASMKGDLLVFKRGLRGGYDPVVPMEAQKEMYEGFRDLVSIVALIQEDKDGTKFINETRLKKSALNLLDSITYKNKLGIYIGHHASRMGRERMPFLYEMLDGVASNVEDDRSKGVTLGGGTEAIGEALSDVLLRKEDGSYEPLIRSSAFDNVSSQQSRVVSKAKESLIAGVMGELLGVDTESESYLDTMMQFRDSIEQINEIAELIREGEAIGGGIINGEEPSQEIARILKVAGVDNIKDATMEIMKQSFTEASILSDIISEAGVSVTSVGGINDVSKIGKRDDFKIELSSEEDYQVFNEFLQDKYGINLQVDKSLPISLKAYFGSSRDYSTGTTSMANSLQAFKLSQGTAKESSLMNTGGETHGSFDNYMKESKLFGSMSDAERSKVVNLKNEATKAMATSIEGVMSLLSSSKVSTGTSSNVILDRFKDMLYDPSNKGITPEKAKQLVADLEIARSSKEAKNSNYKVKKATAKAAAGMINGVRLTMGQNKNQVKGLAINDLISSIYTEDDEALVHSMYGNVRISGRHQLVSFLIQECNPSMNESGTISWKKDGKTVYRTLVREKGGTVIFDGRANPALFSSVGKMFYKEQEGEKQLVKENILRKFEEILGKIDEVFSV